MIDDLELAGYRERCKKSPQESLVWGNNTVGRIIERLDAAERELTEARNRAVNVEGATSALAKQKDALACENAALREAMAAVVPYLHAPVDYIVDGEAWNHRARFLQLLSAESAKSGGEP